VGEVVLIEKRESSTMFSIRFEAPFAKYLIPVGSIAVDGVSLTIAGLMNEQFVVSIIPHTLENTIFQTYQTGTRVNLEFDMVGKYIERMMGGRGQHIAAGEFPTEAELRSNGF
jgi:riboflavin synthase